MAPVASPLSMPFAFPVYRHPPALTYGTGCIKSLGTPGDWEHSVLLVSGAPEVQAYLEQAWAKHGLTLASLRVVTKPAGEPSWEAITATASQLAKWRPARIVAVGGGAVLDWARLAWLASVDALDAEGVVRAGGDAARHEVRVVLVPTTCGSGAEAAPIAVFSRDGRKIPVVSPALLADQVLLDSRFLASVSAATMAASLADALSHAIEAWMSIVPGRLPRQAALSCLRLILHDDGPVYDRHARLMDAGFLGGVAAAHCSVGVVHAFAHSMARYGLGHGHANALALGPALARLLDVPAGRDLLTQLGMSAGALTDRVGALVAPALDHQDSARAVAVLESPDERRALIDAMTVDPCMRTCSLPFTETDMEALLDDVRDGVPQQC